MELTAHLTADDYLAACYLNLRPRPFAKFLWLSYAGTLSLVLFVLTKVHVPGSRVVFIIAGAVVAFLIIEYFIRLPYRARRIYRQQKLLQITRTIRINPDSLETKSELGSSTVPWNMFAHWKENKKLILVYQSDVLFHMFPKRVFTSESDYNEFRNILTKHLGKPKR